MVDNIRRNRAYGLRNALQKLDTLPIVSQRAPRSTDLKFPVGQEWINQTTNDVWILTSIINGIPNWEPITVTAEGEFPISKYMVDADGSAGYTTIQAAINAAETAGITASVYIRPGTYTENLVFPFIGPAINLIGDNRENTIIIGAHTPPIVGTLNVYNLKLQTGVGIDTFSAGAGTAILTFSNCFTNTTNASFINVGSWSGGFTFDNVISVGTNDNFLLVTPSTAPTLIARNSTLGGAGGNAIITGNFLVTDCIFECAVQTTHTTTTKTGTFDNCIFRDNFLCNLRSDSTIVNSYFITGANQAITQQSNIPLKLKNVVIDSTNNPAVGGTSVIEISEITFSQNNVFAAPVTFAGTSVVTTEGISFDANVNILDTYATGTWTPVLEFGGASVGITYNVQQGTYTRIGNLVTVFCAIDLSSKGSSVGNATITGFPFTILEGAANPLGMWDSITLNTGGGYYTPSMFFNGATTTAAFFECGNAVIRSALTNTEFANGTTFYFQASYRI